MSGGCVATFTAARECEKVAPTTSRRRIAAVCGQGAMGWSDAEGSGGGTPLGMRLSPYDQEREEPKCRDEYGDHPEWTEAVVIEGIDVWVEVDVGVFRVVE